MIYTGIDREKAVSIDYSLLKKRWNITNKRGRKIYAVPSHISLIRKGSTQIKDLHTLKSSLRIEIEEKFGNALWDVKLKKGKFCLSLVKDFTPPQDAFSLEPEMFSLTRICRALSVRDCYILDIGRRKTTLIRVVEGNMESYRVVMKGGDFITEHLAKAQDISFEEAEQIKKEKGTKNSQVKEAFEKILSSLGKELTDSSVLLSGGGSKLPGIEEFFGNVLRNKFVPPEMNSAFGASLKFVYEDCAPDFREEELSERDLKKVALMFGASFLLFVSANLYLSFLEKEVVREVRRAEKEAFKRVFPDLPSVAVRDQVKSMVTSGGYELTKAFLKLSDKLREGMEIYKVEFNNGKLRVEGMVKEEKTALEVGAKSIKKTPEGNYEFEVEIE